MTEHTNRIGSVPSSNSEAPRAQNGNGARAARAVTGGSVLPEVRFGFRSFADDAGEWHVARMRATEGMNELYEAEIELATDALFADADRMLGARAELRIERGELIRRFNGVVRRVEDLGTAGHRRLARVFLVPALWTLTQRVTCRIFQNMDVLAIVRAVLADAGVYHDALSVEVTRDYAPREYCVQYNESDYAFVARLLEEEGIALYFTHVDDDSETLVLADAQSAYRPAPTLDGAAVSVLGAEGALHHAEHVRTFQWHREMRPTGVILRDFDFTRPAAHADMTATRGTRAAGDRVVYEYPGRHTLHAYTGETYGRQTGTRRADARMADLTHTAQLGSGRGNVSGLMPGLLFDLAGHGRAELDQSYMVLRVLHSGSAPEVLHADSTLGGASADRYSNEFETIPANTMYRPQARTPRPHVRGPQTALVVGPPGEEIHVDNHGRIKLQFHWDLQGEFDDGSSAWIRVAQSWGGGAWGTMFIPRVGMEVVVNFLDGDPDRPLVTGCVYNGANGTPYELPANKTRMTIRSNSSPGGGGFNELRFEDSAGNEEVFMHAQKDQNEVIGNNHTTTVGANQTLTVTANQDTSVGGNQSNTVTGNQTESITGNQTLSVTGNRSAAVTGNESLFVLGNQTAAVVGNQTETVTGNRTLTVISDDTVSVTGHQSVSVASSADMAVTGSYNVTATSMAMTSVGSTHVTLDTSAIAGHADTNISFNVGSSTVNIGPDFIQLKTSGATVTLKGAKLTFEAAEVTGTASGTLHLDGKDAKLHGSASTDVGCSGGDVKVHASATATVNGSGASLKLASDAELKGATVKLNE